ncbi:uncharacterized protein LOC113367051 [Ctenocephalides felis]|uniref:uncharacterized protein LOC113367051 n=1 Tax=Ctenocephalides felis TaxID=7515 RepID=UPI000E6E25FF|nr:uncharacterized protein LOC113367051 [Ctenocephalides felis]
MAKIKAQFSTIIKCIFGLRLFDNVGKRKVWLAPSSKIDKNEKYELRIRFKVSSLSRLFNIDQNVYDYFFHQARRDILSNDVAEINYTEQKGELLGLSVTDMCREMIEHNLSAEEIKRNFKKYIPREIVYEKEYLKQLDKMAPNYLSEEYVATADTGEAVFLRLSPYHLEFPGLQFHTHLERCN